MKIQYHAMLSLAPIRRMFLMPAICGLFASQSLLAAVIIQGPTDYNNLATATVTSLPLINTAELASQDVLQISYSVSRANTTTGDSWLVLALNTPGSFFAFTSGGDGGALLRTMTAGPLVHAFFQASSGSWAPDDSSVDFDAISPAEHAVMITIGGLGGTGFTGLHTLTYEIDHNATSFGSADRTFTGTIDFGATDNGLALDLRSNGKTHNVHNLTIAAIPEPSSVALLCLGGLPLLRRRRSD